MLWLVPARKPTERSDCRKARGFIKLLIILQRRGQAIIADSSIKAAALFATADVRPIIDHALSKFLGNEPSRFKKPGFRQVTCTGNPQVGGTNRLVRL